VLLTQPTSLPASTASELARLGVSEVRVLGGSGAVSDSVVNSLVSSYTVTRVAGADRFATAAEISKSQFSPGVAVAYVATGLNFPDALAGTPPAAVGGPILLVQKSSIPGPTSSELARLGPSTIKILGGTGVVDSSVQSALGAFASTVERLAGSDRFSTAAAISKDTFSPGVGTIYVATGENFPDALAGGAAAGMGGGPILLVQQNSLPSATAAEIARLTGQPCPTLRSFGDGTWIVGTEVQPDTYRNSDSSGGCFWARLSGFGGTLAETITNDFTSEISIVTIEPTDVGFQTDRCGTWSNDLSPRTSSPTADFGGGHFQVGSEIASGRWRNSDSSGGCFWERLSGFRGELGDTITNEFSSVIEIVDIASSDSGFHSERCGTWSRDLTPRTSSPSEPFTGGHFLVGSEVAAGTWRNDDSSGGCFWERLSGFSGELGDTIANNFSTSIQTVTISDTDTGFFSDRCGSWTKIG
jgi:hypothetical protein